MDNQIFSPAPHISQGPFNSQGKIPPASPKARLILGLVGFIFMVIGIYFMTSTLMFTLRAVETTGTIIGNKTMTNIRDRRTTVEYCPQAEFSADGKQYQFTNNICSNSRYFIGAKVEVLYDSKNPKNARIKGPSQWIIPIIFIIIGGLTFFGAVFNKIKMSRG